jgi:sulfate transport system substrate-binding protein
MAMFNKTKKLILGIGICIILFLILFILYRGQRVPTTLNFGTPTDHCVPPKDTPPVKLFHMALGVADFYTDYNKLFTDKWKCVTGQTVTIDQGYDVSGEIMRNMIKESMAPDILTFSNPAEVDSVATVAGIISPSWRADFPDNSSPYYSAVVFVVRKGNPFAIKDWADLIKPGITLLASNPKLCGGGRWVYTAALGYAMGQSGPLSEESKKFLTQFYSNFPVIYADQGHALTAYLKENAGDVLVTYEQTALAQKANNQPIDVVAPSRTVAMEIPVVIAVKYAQKDGVMDIAKAYINGLYDPTIQKLIAQHHLRPRITTLSADLLSQFPVFQLFTRKDVYGSDTTGKNNSIENAHLKDGGIFDTITGK